MCLAWASPLGEPCKLKSQIWWAKLFIFHKNRLNNYTNYIDCNNETILIFSSRTIWCVQLFISILTDSVSGQKMTIENTSGILPARKHQIKTNISLFCSFSNLLSSVSLCKSSWLAMKNSTSTLVRESNQSGWINTNMSSRRSNRLRRREPSSPWSLPALPHV